MVFKSFRFAVLFRIVLLFVGLLLSAFLFENKQFILFSPLTFLLNIAQAYELMVYIGAMEREVIRFTESVKYLDFTQSYFIAGSPASVKTLRRAFNEVNKAFRQLNADKETQFQQLHTIMEIIDTGILCFTEDDEVKWMNESFRKLFSLPTLKNLSGLINRNVDLQKLLSASQTHNSRVVQLNNGKKTIKILVSSATFRIEGKLNYLMSIKNINDAVDEAETLAWQKLLRVLTHEIMNSVAPISSLAETLQQRLSIAENNPDPELLDDMRLSIDVIRNRSEGLMKFADTYRNLSKLSQLSLSSVYLRELFQQVERLFMPEFQHHQIEFHSNVSDPQIRVEIDVPLIEQVLLNLILNAIDVLKNQTSKKIRLLGFLNDRGRVVIQLIDNGPGIPEELKESIFVPFFSTKKEGSGVGLSLSKQIMQLHKGSISLESELGMGCNFQLSF